MLHIISFLSFAMLPYAVCFEGSTMIYGAKIQIISGTSKKSGKNVTNVLKKYTMPSPSLSTDISDGDGEEIGDIADGYSRRLWQG